MGTFIAVIVLLVVISVAERLSIYITGYTSESFRVFKVILVLGLIGSFFKACGII